MKRRLVRLYSFQRNFLYQDHERCYIPRVLDKAGDGYFRFLTGDRTFVDPPAPKNRHEGMDLKPVISAPLNDERDPQRVKNEFSATVAAMMNDAGMKNL